MAVFASTADPSALVRRVTETVKRGTVATWELTSGHLRHTDPRLAARIGAPVAFFTMTVTGSTVKFTLARCKNAPAFDATAYAYHHGRLTELLLGRFSDLVTRVQSTPFPGPMDAMVDPTNDVMND